MNLSPTYIVPVANAAGSVGKTTTIVTLGALLAEQGRQVLLIDLDGQATATEWLGHDPDPEEGRVATSVGVMLGDAELVDSILTTNVENLLLVPASRRNFDGAVIRFSSGRAPEQQLKRVLQDCPAEIDTVLIDCPGNLGPITMAALVPATSVITIAVPAKKEVKGVPYMEEFTEEIASYYNPDLELGAIVPCSVPSKRDGKLYVDYLAALITRYDAKVTPPVRRSVRAGEAMDQNIPLPVGLPTEDVTNDYREVLKHLQQAGVL